MTKNSSHQVINSYTRLHFGHTILLHILLNYPLTSRQSPLRTLFHAPAVCDFNHNLCDCPALSALTSFFPAPLSLNISLNSHHHVSTISSQSHLLLSLQHRVILYALQRLLYSRFWAALINSLGK